MRKNRFWETLSPAQAKRDWWETGVDGVPAIPVLAARGAGDGPSLVVTGAVHGDEYEGPAAIHALFAALDPARLRGRVLALPVVNRAAWRARQRTTPVDDGDLNRLFPGTIRDAGQDTGPDTDQDAPSPTPALARAIFDTFVRSCDVLIDLHSGGVRLRHLPMIGWYAGNARAEALARRFDPLFHPWLMFDRAGVLSRQAHVAGKVSLGAEWGGGAALDAAGAAAYAAGLRRVLVELEMMPRSLLPDAAHGPDERDPITGSYQAVDGGGLFVPAVALGQTVAAGDLLGRLHDELGTVTAAVRAERSGIVAALPHLAWIHPGDRIAYIG